MFSSNTLFSGHSSNTLVSVLSGNSSNRESDRVKALQAVNLLDSEPTDRFDNITRLVANVFDVPIALISLVDEDRQWFLSSQGLDIKETPRCEAFCSQAIKEEQLLVIEDASLHPDFEENPLVLGHPNIRFYAGAVIRDENGHPFGTLCIIDSKPGKLSQKAEKTLLSFMELARQEILLPDDLTIERLKARLKLHKDSVTNTLVDSAFFEACEREIPANRIAGDFHLITVKMSNLKWISDAFAPHVADEMMVDLISRLRASVDTRYRVLFGRAETTHLCALLLSPLSESEVNTLARELKQSLKGAVSTTEADILPSLIVTITRGTANTHEVKALFKIASRYSHSLPNREGLRVSVLTENELIVIERRVQIVKALREALDTQSLQLAFQPKVCAMSQELIGLEALLRWHHHELGAIRPDIILDAAVEANLLCELEKWVFDTALKRISEWQQAGFSVPRVSVNVTGETLLQPGFSTLIEQRLADYNLSGGVLDIEIVESSVFDDFEATVIIMERLQKTGITFSLDDFGTGFSSLSYLRNLPITNLKIDKSFVDNIIECQEAATLCGGIISLAKSLDLHIVAEGVETESQFIVLRALRCDSFQGYYFSKPMPACEIENMFEKYDCSD